jgi:cytochrome c
MSQAKVAADGISVGGTFELQGSHSMRFEIPTTISLFISTIVFTFNAPQVVSAKSDPSEFKRYCSVCHSVEEGKNKIGPSLAKIVGRHSASIETFGYSEPMRKLGVVWTSENLDRFLTNPPAMVPGTRMAFPGLKNTDERKALIDYLAEPGD